MHQEPNLSNADTILVPFGQCSLVNTKHLQVSLSIQATVDDAVPDIVVPPSSTLTCSVLLPLFSQKYHHKAEDRWLLVQGIWPLTLHRLRVVAVSLTTSQPGTCIPDIRNTHLCILFEMSLVLYDQYFCGVGIDKVVLDAGGGRGCYQFFRIISRLTVRIITQ